MSTQAAHHQNLFNVLETKENSLEIQELISTAEHDIQGALRKILISAESLQLKMQDRLDPDAAKDLLRVLEASRHLHGLSRGLLHFSRASTKTLVFQRVHLQGLVQDALANLELKVDQACASIHLEVLPITIEVDRPQMQQLIEQILDNSLKFKRKDTPLQIRIQAELQADGGTCILAFHDNGVGFDNCYAERIFKPLEKLHGSAEFPGAGMGLSVCKKIISRHQGSIWAQSAPGQGSIFFVKIPLVSTSTPNKETPL